MPQNVLKKINANISPELKACFFSAIIVGLFAHLYKITNWLPNWDSLVFRYDTQNMLELGRWFLPVACAFSSFYDLPFLNGVIALVFHALGAACICKTLNIKQNTTAFLIGAVIVSFPTVTSVLMYNYVADGYSIAFFFSTLSAFFMTREKPKYVIASIFCALSTGIYQAYITVTIMLVLLRLIDEIIYNNKGFNYVFKKSACMLLSGVGGVVLYAVILKVCLAVFSVELLEYQGIHSAASFSSINLLGSLYVIKQTFIKCFFDISNGVSVYVVLNAVIVVITLIHYIRYIIINKLYKNPINMLMVVILSVMLIVGAGALAFVNSGIDYHNLMLMGYVVFYLFFVALYERGASKSEMHANIKCWVIFIITVVIVLNQIVIANTSYHKAQIAYEKSFGVLMRIADRIEQTPNSQECDKILVLGALDNSEDYSANISLDITGITDGYIIRADDEMVDQSVLCSSLNDYCDKNYEFISGEQKKEIAQKEQVKNMQAWPDKSCVAVIDDIVVIKLGVEGEK